MHMKYIWNIFGIYQEIQEILQKKKLGLLLSA